VKTKTILLLAGAAAVVGYLYVRRKSSAQVVARTQAVQASPPNAVEVVEYDDEYYVPGWTWARPVWGARSWAGHGHGHHGHSGHGHGHHGGGGRGGRR